jgi:hypothetical protein
MAVRKPVTEVELSMNRLLIIAKWAVVAVMITAAVIAPGCSSEKDILEGRNVVIAQETENLIASELAEGANQAAIEEFFRRHNIPFTFDDFASRYQAIIRDVSDDPRAKQSVIIYIYVDEEHRLLRTEVFDSFTVP